MKTEMDKILSLLGGDSTAELQKYLSTLKNDQVVTPNDQVYNKSQIDTV